MHEGRAVQATDGGEGGFSEGAEGAEGAEGGVGGVGGWCTIVWLLLLLTGVVVGLGGGVRGVGGDDVCQGPLGDSGPQLWVDEWGLTGVGG